MNLTFANPLALWALLGIPVILLIHFLQRERRQVRASTIFLLDMIRQESKGGIRFERLRNSLPLWLQILTVVLIAWILSEPRRPVSESFQRIVVVMDSSASMAAFEDEARDALRRPLARLGRLAAHHEWIAIETDAQRETLYSGNSASELHDSMAGWIPRSGTHDPGPALRRALSLVRGEGTVLFVTDRQYENLPAGVQLLAIGEPIENVGFTGLVFEERDDRLIWRAMVKNFSDTPQHRSWHARLDGRSTEPQALELLPDQSITLSGVFPDDADSGALVLDEDAFPLDDWLPLVRPSPKELVVQTESHPLLNEFLEAFLPSVSHLRMATDPFETIDFQIATRLPEQDMPERPGIYFLLTENESPQAAGAPLIPENHPLMRDLNWQGLLIEGGTVELAPRDDDDVLLWQGEHPLLLLRGHGSERRLLINFDLRRSNAQRLPAFVILLHRFIDSVRSAKTGFERRNLQAGQRFAAGADPLGPPVEIFTRSRAGDEEIRTIPAHRAVRLSAPRETGFLEVQQGDSLLMAAAVHFADAREADFRGAQTTNQGQELETALRERLTQQGFLTPVWLLLLGLLLFITWRLIGRSP